MLYKEELAESITKNSVYTLKSQMRQDVMKGLRKLSYSELENLKMLVEIRVVDARRVTQPPPKKGKKKE